MLLKSSLFILLLVNIFTSNLIILSAILIVVLILNLILNKNLKKHSKQLKVLLFFYLSTFLIQLYYGQQGKVLFKFYSFYITQEGLINFGVSFIRILNFQDIAVEIMRSICGSIGILVAVPLTAYIGTMIYKKK